LLLFDIFSYHAAPPLHWPLYKKTIDSSTQFDYFRTEQFDNYRIV